MEIKVEKKEVYGRVLYYPKCEKSELIAEWFSKQTLNDQDLDSLEKLGFKIIVL